MNDLRMQIYMHTPSLPLADLLEVTPVLLALSEVYHQCLVSFGPSTMYVIILFQCPFALQMSMTATTKIK